jgi:cytochrome c oxidase assembly factor CtaG
VLPEPAPSGKHNLNSNPGRGLAVRIVVGGAGGLLIYAALPFPLEGDSWWDYTAHAPFIAGVIALVLAVCAPARWCELFIP